MTPEQVMHMGNELILTALLLAAPAVLTSLVIGLLVSIFQVVTSIQEQTLTFAPRIVAVGVVMLVALPWSLGVLTNFTQGVMLRFVDVVR